MTTHKVPRAAKASRSDARVGLEAGKMTECPICDSPALAAASSLHALGADIGEIAETTSLDADDLKKHFTVCSPPIPNENELTEDVDSLTMSDQRLQRLLEDAIATYHVSQIQGNLVAATASLAVRLRCETEVGKRLQARKEEESSYGPLTTDPVTWPSPIKRMVRNWCDSLLANHDAGQQS